MLNIYNLEFLLLQATKRYLFILFIDIREILIRGGLRFRVFE